MIFAVDFDGTLVSNAYPAIGSPKLDVINKTIALQKQGHTIVLWTCRTDELLDEAVEFLKSYGLICDYINDHTDANLARFGKAGRKVGADYYIDDKNLSVDEFLKIEV